MSNMAASLVCNNHYRGDNVPSGGHQSGGWGGSCSWRSGELEGAWVNVDCPSERYFIEGLRVTRMDARGTKAFTIYWDQYKQQWQWGMHGRLSLQWLGENMIAWVPYMPEYPCYARVWRWQRCGPQPQQQPPAVLEQPGPSSYGPTRASRSNHSSQPYQSSHPWRRSASTDIPNDRRSISSWRHSHRNSHGHRRHRDRDHRGGRDDDRDYRGDHRDRRDHRDNRDIRDHRDHRDHRHRWPHSAGSHSIDPLPCGLTIGEVCSLLTREIRPEDYDMLLRLDETVPRQTASVDRVQSLPKSSCEEFMGRDCTVCMSSFVASDSVVGLQCRHHFHSSCITKWLTECRRSCPLCGAAFSA